MNIAYPRPQFVRQEWLSLEGAWQYSFSESKQPSRVEWLGDICVPFPPESALSGVKNTGYHPVVWYRRTFQAPDAWQGRRLLLNFGAVDYQARVWVNGQLVADHEGGHTPFSMDITDALVPGEQTLIVRAADEPLDMEKPRGKQDWEPEPHAIWYPRTSGIWQPVWLEPVSDIRLEHLRLTPNLDAWAIDMEVKAVCEDCRPDGLTLDVQVFLDDNLLLSTTLETTGTLQGGALTLERRLDLPQSSSAAARQTLLWSPENPVLFDLILTLREDGAVLDRVETYTGLRSVETRDGQFYLNGQPYFLQMVLDQGYWTESLLAAPSPEALRKDVELSKALGFNGARKHQKIEDPRYLYWADRLGLIVWGELPSAYKFSPNTARRLSAELAAMIERDYNHPCIVAWVPLNESWGIPDVISSIPQRHLAKTLYNQAKSLDTTRLVVDNDGWEHCDTDLLTIHDYENLPDVFIRRYNSHDFLTDQLQHGKKVLVDGFALKDQPVILSEFGGIRLGEGIGWGYQQVTTAEEFLERFAPLMRSVYCRKLTGYCYTQLTDTFQEQNGLLYMDRSPKIDPVIVARILQAGLLQWQSELAENHEN